MGQPVESSDQSLEKKIEESLKISEMIETLDEKKMIKNEEEKEKKSNQSFNTNDGAAAQNIIADPLSLNEE